MLTGEITLEFVILQVEVQNVGTAEATDVHAVFVLADHDGLDQIHFEVLLGSVLLQIP